jgi:hypothetical protein
MKCMIWEPQPVCARLEQNESFPLSSETIKSLPDYIKNKLSATDGLQGVWIKEKIVYNSNFLTIKNQLIEPYRDDMQAYFDINQTTGEFAAKKDWVPHHMWRLEGSLFDNETISPLELLQRSDRAQNPKFSKWNHEVVSVPRDAKVVEAPATSDTIKELDQTQVFMPSQGAASQASRWADDGDSGQKPKGIHWKVTKQTPLFQGEDFWVEFRRRAVSGDTRDANEPLAAQYYYLDSLYVPGVYPTNAGVVDLDDAGNIVEESRQTMNFNSQPYYIIEMGKGTKHHYFIILAENARPRFVHVADDIPVIIVDPELGMKVEVPPALECSRVLSVYDKVSSKELMAKDVLRVQVRQHMGYIIVTFAGYEGTPWIIGREDPVQISGSEEWATNPQDYVGQRKAMVIPKAPISLYGGNLKVAWSFGPMIYEAKASITIPQAIIVKGPVSKGDVSLFLCEQTPNTDTQTRRANPFIYNQDAEEYWETKNGADATVTRQKSVQPEKVTKAGKAPDKNGQGLKNSSIRITPRTELVQSGGDDTSGGEGTGTADENADTALSSTEQMAQAFYAEYTLTAGDYEFPADPTAGAKNSYKLENCITPIATGWRMNVPAAGRSPTQSMFDAAHHVTQFADSWTAQDTCRIDHSGNITFLITPGQNNIPRGMTDFSERLANLHDKTFFIRVSAWWDDGFMSCLPGCSRCDSCRTCADANVVITGLCHGGVISTQGSTKKFMECQILDYWKILQDMAFVNSPFFDGMRDFNAVFTIMKMAGFRDGSEKALQSLGGRNNDRWAPLSLLKIFANSPNADIQVAWPSSPCGLTGGSALTETINSWEFVLPSSYDVLQSPNMKFADSTKFEDGITDIARKSGKVAFFDRWGVFHYENRKEEQTVFSGADPLELCEMHFYASPKDIPDNPCKDMYRQIIGGYTYKRNVADVVNIVHILSTTPEGTPVFADNVNWESIYNPNSPGYIGYRKMAVQTNGIFGNQESVNKVAEYYSSAFNAPVAVSFTTFGNGRLRPLQLVSFTGLQIDGTELYQQPFRLLSVSSTIEPSEQKWETRYDAEWLFLNA